MLFISCGEASGDQYAARLMGELNSSRPSVWGMGGAGCGCAGMETVWDCRDIQVMGIVEVISRIPAIWRRMDEICRTVIARAPKVAVLVDSPDFHLPLARKLKKAGYRGTVINLIPPTVWAWRSGRVKTLAAYMDLCLPLFPFEHAYLETHSVASAHVGHPLLDDIAAHTPSAEGKVVAFLPGSRDSEVRRLLPHMVGAAQMMRDAGYEPVFSSAPSLGDDTAGELAQRAGAFKISAEPGRELMGRCACVVCASGTATLQAMLLRRPMVAAYMANGLSLAIARRFVKTKYFAQPNFLAGHMVFPELLQEQVTAQALYEGAIRFLEASENERVRTDALFTELRGKLGKNGAYGMWANKVASYL